jgi:hypothetical protein
VSSVIPLIEHVVTVSKPDADLPVAGNDIKEKIKSYILQEYDYEDDALKSNSDRLQLLAMATILDPRYKSTLISQDLAQVNMLFIFIILLIAPIIRYALMSGHVLFTDSY